MERFEEELAKIKAIYLFYYFLRILEKRQFIVIL